MSAKKKILIDMDIGDDIDDAIALYAAMRRGFEIVGVTTVFRNTVDRARQAKKLLKEYGKGYETVPVFFGYGTPLESTETDFDHIPHYTPDLESDRYAPDGKTPEDAVNFIVDACRRYGKDLTVVAIGPFTNLAKVIEQDPEALSLADQVVIMGGAYYKQYADWNVMCDVAAADLMFRSLDNLACLGADVTHLTVGEDALYENLLNYAGEETGHRYLTELCRLWRQDRPRAKLLLHDPLVIYYLDDPALCGMNPVSVAVMTEGFARGMTLNVDAYGKKKMNPAAYAEFNDTRKALVAETVDRETFNRRILKDFSV
ncbi:MAG: nucleoside hydrolase [Clostridia bacterium]|nr:nucleoside hydrolase [Clostridia bacterium]